MRKGHMYSAKGGRFEGGRRGWVVQGLGGKTETTVLEQYKNYFKKSRKKKEMKMSDNRKSHALRNLVSQSWYVSLHSLHKTSPHFHALPTPHYPPFPQHAVSFHTFIYVHGFGYNVLPSPVHCIHP